MTSSTMEYKRTDRVGDQIKMEVADILLKKAKDPRIEMVTILSVDVSPDLSHAKVYISLPESANEKSALIGLKNAAGFVRSELSRRLPLKRVPDILFLVDHAQERISRLLTLLEEVGTPTAVSEEQKEAQKDKGETE